MTTDLSAAALLAAAEAFLARGNSIQYDQRSMDRVVQITPRRDKLAPPEAATEQHMLFLDCSSFVNAVYHAAFGRVLDADLTWHMAQMLQPCVLRWQTSHTETPEERRRISNETAALLRPGDLLVMDKGSNGHVVLIGDGVYYHCNQKGGEKGYRYDLRQEAFTPGGAVYREPLAALLNSEAPNQPDICCVFDDAVQGFCVLRPLPRMGMPTPAAVARLKGAAGLHCSVLSSHPGGRSAAPGETVTYTVCIHSRLASEQSVQVTFTPPALCGGGTQSVLLALPAGEAAQAAFSLTTPSIDEPFLEAPAVTVNGLPVWAERVLLHGGLSSIQQRQVTTAVRQAAAAGQDIWAAAAQGYALLGISLPAGVPETLAALFRRYDAVPGDVLWRLPQQPRRDASLYGFFGGTGVITPEAGGNSTIRTRRITLADLAPGDIILCSSDALFRQTAVLCLTEDGLLCQDSGQITLLRLEDAQRKIESLPGQFCYIVLRPSAAERI